MQGDGPYAVAIRREEPRRANDPTQRLNDLKVALESDPRPRYVVIKDGMDHGPFSAVELLQQIASALFTEDNVLRDTFSGEERFIKEWDEFAPFAQQSKLNRAIVQEKKDLDAVVVAEKRGTQYKALIGAAVIGVFAAGGAGWWMRERANQDRELVVHGQEVTSIDVDAGSLRGGKTVGDVTPGGGGGVRPGGGNYPQLAGGMSCEGARPLRGGLRQGGPARPLGQRLRQRAQQRHVPQQLRRPFVDERHHLRRRAERARRRRHRQHQPQGRQALVLRRRSDPRAQLPLAPPPRRHHHIVLDRPS